MTQGNVTTYELDGSAMTGTFTQGKIFKISNSKWDDWDSTSIQQSETGYDVEQNEKDAQWNHHDTLKSQYILTFPNIDAAGNLSKEEAREEARTDSHQSRISTEGGNSRYVHETVKISLRSAAKIMGEKSTVRSAN